MRKSIMVCILISGLAAIPSLRAQNRDEEVARLAERVAQLEKQVREISQLVEPLKGQQAAEARRKMLRARFEKQVAQDRQRYAPEQLREAETLYQVANQKWGSAEALESLQAMIKKYPQINRTGCAVLYVAQKSQGEERAKYLRECIEKYNDCMYGDGVQVGAYARFLQAADFQSRGDEPKAAALYAELKANFADAIDHSGNLLADSIKAEAK